MPGSPQFSSKIDADSVVLVISNLLCNAIDVTPASGLINVHLALLGNSQVITVQDCGPGVEDYALPRLGERFFNTPRPSGECSGNGLGLAIVRETISLHGGQLRLKNAPRGFCAELLLPISRRNFCLIHVRFTNFN